MNNSEEKSIGSVGYDIITEILKNKNSGIKKILFHYTSTESFMKIIENKSIWFTRYDFFNDPTEGKDIITMYEKACTELLNEGLDEEYIDSIKNLIPNKTRIIKLENPTPDEDGKLIETYGVTDCDKTDVYICSFSKESDSLIMWNYYNNGDLTNCCNFSIECEAIKNNYKKKSIELTFEEVIYDEKEKIGNLCKIIKSLYNVRNQDPNFEKTKSLIKIVLENLQFRYKNKGYSDEQEIRAIFYVPRKEDENEEKFNKNIKYRTAHGMIIPYIIMQLDVEGLWNICLGPRNCYDKSIETMYEYLESIDIQASVRKSDIPLKF